MAKASGTGLAAVARAVGVVGKEARARAVRSASDWLTVRVLERAVRHALLGLKQTEAAAVNLRRAKREIYSTLMSRKWRACGALLSLEVPDGAEWTGKASAAALPAATLADLFAAAVQRLEGADECDIVPHLQ
eukprot:752114-Prorocentrum_minimum.AAC.1